MRLFRRMLKSGHERRGKSGGERDETKNKGGLDSELATETVNVAAAVLIRAEVGCEERL